MGWTKRDYVSAALEEIGLSSYAVDIPPEMEQIALRRLDAMIAEWNAQGIRLGWPISSAAIIDPEVDTGTTDKARSAIISGLAVLLSGPFGKAISPQTIEQASKALATLVRDSVQYPGMQMPNNFPAGAGWKQATGQVFLDSPETAIPPEPDCIFEDR